MEKADVRELAEAVANSVTSALRGELVDRINDGYKAIQEDIRRQGEQHMKDMGAVNAKLSTTAQALSGCVTKIEHLHARVFTGNGQPSLLAEVAEGRRYAAVQAARAEEAVKRIEQLEKFRNWAITSLITAAVGALIGLLGWLAARVIG